MATVILVSHGYILTDAQGLIASNACAVRVWTTDASNFILAPPCMQGDNLQKERQPLLCPLDIKEATLPMVGGKFLTSVVQTLTVWALILQVIRPCASVRTWPNETTCILHNDWLHPSFFLPT